MSESNKRDQDEGRAPDTVQWYPESVINAGQTSAPMSETSGCDEVTLEMRPMDSSDPTNSELFEQVTDYEANIQRFSTTLENESFTSTEINKNQSGHEVFQEAFIGGNFIQISGQAEMFTPGVNLKSVSEQPIELASRVTKQSSISETNASSQDALSTPAKERKMSRAELLQKSFTVGDVTEGPRLGQTLTESESEQATESVVDKQRQSSRSEMKVTVKYKSSFKIPPILVRQPPDPPPAKINASIQNVASIELPPMYEHDMRKPPLMEIIKKQAGVEMSREASVGRNLLEVNFKLEQPKESAEKTKRQVLISEEIASVHNIVLVDTSSLLKSEIPKLCSSAIEIKKGAEVSSGGNPTQVPGQANILTNNLKLDSEQPTNYAANVQEQLSMSRHIIVSQEQQLMLEQKMPMTSLPEKIELSTEVFQKGFNEQTQSVADVQRQPSRSKIKLPDYNEVSLETSPVLLYKKTKPSITDMEQKKKTVEKFIENDLIEVPGKPKILTPRENLDSTQPTDVPDIYFVSKSNPELCSRSSRVVPNYLNTVSVRSVPLTIKDKLIQLPAQAELLRTNIKSKSEHPAESVIEAIMQSLMLAIESAKPEVSAEQSAVNSMNLDSGSFPISGSSMLHKLPGTELIEVPGQARILTHREISKSDIKVSAQAYVEREKSPISVRSLTTARKDSAFTLPHKLPGGELIEVPGQGKLLTPRDILKSKSDTKVATRLKMDLEQSNVSMPSLTSSQKDSAFGVHKLPGGELIEVPGQDKMLTFRNLLTSRPEINVSAQPKAPDEISETVAEIGKSSDLTTDEVVLDRNLVPASPLGAVLLLPRGDLMVTCPGEIPQSVPKKDKMPHKRFVEMKPLLEHVVSRQSLTPPEKNFDLGGLQESLSEINFMQMPGLGRSSTLDSDDTLAIKKSKALPLSSDVLAETLQQSSALALENVRKYDPQGKDPLETVDQERFPSSTLEMKAPNLKTSKLTISIQSFKDLATKEPVPDQILVPAADLGVISLLPRRDLIVNPQGGALVLAPKEEIVPRIRFSKVALDPVVSEPSLPPLENESTLCHLQEPLPEADVIQFPGPVKNLALDRDVTLANEGFSLTPALVADTIPQSRCPLKSIESDTPPLGHLSRYEINDLIRNIEEVPSKTVKDLVPKAKTELHGIVPDLGESQQPSNIEVCDQMSLLATKSLTSGSGVGSVPVSKDVPGPCSTKADEEVQPLPDLAALVTELSTTTLKKKKTVSGLNKKSTTTGLELDRVLGQVDLLASGGDSNLATEDVQASKFQRLAKDLGASKTLKVDKVPKTPRIESAAEELTSSSTTEIKYFSPNFSCEAPLMDTGTDQDEAPSKPRNQLLRPTGSIAEEVEWPFKLDTKCSVSDIIYEKPTMTGIDLVPVPGRVELLSPGDIAVIKKLKQPAINELEYSSKQENDCYAPEISEKPTITETDMVPVPGKADLLSILPPGGGDSVSESKYLAEPLSHPLLTQKESSCQLLKIEEDDTIRPPKLPPCSYPILSFDGDQKIKNEESQLHFYKPQCKYETIAKPEAKSISIPIPEYAEPDIIVPPDIKPMPLGALLYLPKGELMRCTRSDQEPTMEPLSLPEKEPRPPAEADVIPVEESPEQSLALTPVASMDEIPPYEKDGIEPLSYYAYRRGRCWLCCLLQLVVVFVALLSAGWFFWMFLIREGVVDKKHLDFMSFLFW